MLTAIGVLAAFSLAAVAAVTILGGEDPDNRYAEEWDPLIEPLARFVEQERGLPFDNPVYVDFLEPSDFKEDFAAEEETDDERLESDRYVGLYRAFGLMSGDVDLLDTTSTMLADGVLAYYSPETKRITVNGELDATTRLTVVHELTHAWQDQQYDLLEIESDLDAARLDTFTAMVEGDASRIEYRYYEQLPEAEKLEVDEGATIDFEEADFARFPRALVALFGAPYSLGEPFIGILSELRGETAVDQAILSPPASYEQLLDPFAYLDGDEPTDVAEPALADGEELLESGELGSLMLYLILNERLGPEEALAVADGWAGDAYVAFTRDGRSCARVQLQAEGPDALSRLAGALEAWRVTMPGGMVHIVVDTGVLLETCDPGADAVFPSIANPELDPLVYPSVRSEIVRSVLVENGDRDLAQCFATRYLDSLTIEHLMSETDEFAAEFDALGTAAAEACIAGG